MKYVKLQLELIKRLCDDMLSTISDRSCWKDDALHRRVQEAKAIESAAKTLVDLVKRRKM